MRAAVYELSGPRNKGDRGTLLGMRPRFADVARARAEALFHRRPPEAEAPATALAKYRASQEATRQRTRKLRALRRARKSRRTREG